MSAQAIKKLTEKIEQLESRIEQLYKAQYNPPTNNDLQKSLNDLLDKTYLKHLGISFKESYKKCFKLEEKKISHEKPTLI